MKRLIYILLGAILLSSCKQLEKIVEKPVYIHDTLTQQTFIHDSIYKHDSTFVLVKGDTVYIDRTHTKYRYKLIHDTTSVVKEIPVEVTTTEIKEVEKPLKWWKTGFIFVGVVSLVVLIGYIVVKLIRKRI